MDDKEKEVLRYEAMDGINNICKAMIERAVDNELFEEAAAIRDAREELKDAIEIAIDRLPPF